MVNHPFIGFSDGKPSGKKGNHDITMVLRLKKHLVQEEAWNFLHGLEDEVPCTVETLQLYEPWTNLAISEDL